MIEDRRDIRILFATRIVRLFSYGFLSIILVLYLAAAGLTEERIGLLLTLTLVGDTLVSFFLTTRADRLGRKRVLVLGSLLILAAGLAFASTASFLILLVAATFGVISPSGHEVGPFLAIEQAALAQTMSGERRTSVFAWYNLVGSFATAGGALAAGELVSRLRAGGASEVSGYRVIVVLYAIFGGVLAVLFSRLTAGIEHGSVETSRHPLERSRSIVAKLSSLFALDSFAGGFVVQSIVAYWFHVRFDVPPQTLGQIFFGANLLAGVSALAAASIAARIGLVNTMVFTHLPSNVLLILVPLMPDLKSAIAVLLVRFSISQMDVPTRQSYVMAVVPPEERSAAAGVTGVARTLGAALAPIAATPLIGHPTLNWLPFVIAGGLKILYDLMILWNFRKIRETH